MLNYGREPPARVRPSVAELDLRIQRLHSIAIETGDTSGLFGLARDREAAEMLVLGYREMLTTIAYHGLGPEELKSLIGESSIKIHVSKVNELGVTPAWSIAHDLSSRDKHLALRILRKDPKPALLDSYPPKLDYRLLGLTDQLGISVADVIYNTWPELGHYFTNYSGGIALNINYGEYL